MENKKISCSYALLVIILFAALAFVTVYAYVQDKIRTCNCPNCESQNVATDCSNNVVSDDDSNDVISDSNDVSVLKDIGHNNMFGEIIVNKDGFIYFKADERYNFNFSTDFVKGTYRVDDYILGPEWNDFEGYKLNTSNVRSASSFDTGNGGVTVSVVLITRDNKVEIIDFNNSNGNNVDVTYKKVDTLSNIISVSPRVEFGGHDYVLYDINGNQYTNF